MTPEEGETEIGKINYAKIMHKPKITKILTILGVFLILIGFVILVPAFSSYNNWNENKLFWDLEKEGLSNHLENNPDDNNTMSQYLQVENFSSHAEEKSKESLNNVFIGLIISFIGFLLVTYLYKDQIRNKIRYIKEEKRTANTIRFCVATLSIICGIFFILLIFYQYIEFYFIRGGLGADRDFTKLWISGIPPEIFHPGIFIPQGLIFLLLGGNLVYVVKKKINFNLDEKLFNRISSIIMILIISFVMVFLIGLMLGRILLGSYGVVNSLISIVIMILIIIITILIYLYVNKNINFPNKERHKEGLSKNLTDYRILNYKIISLFMAFLFILAIILLFVFAYIAPTSYQSVYWENEESPNKVVLPGMNVTYNLYVENREGSNTNIFVIMEMNNGVEGNWSVNAKKITLKPNEVKAFTFTNYIPQNASDGERYHYTFFIGDGDDSGLSTLATEGISTEVTRNLAEYYFYQAHPSTTPPAVVWSGGVKSSSFYGIMSRLASITFLTWIVITVLFALNERKLRNEIKKNVDSSPLNYP
jgi:uncharacterized membrane protein YidH (DUF202 family)